MAGIDRFPAFVHGFSEAALPFEDARGWLIQGDRAQVVFIEFDKAVDVPEHSHQEQWEIVMSGAVLLRVDGKEREYRAGEAFFIPAGVPHSAEVRAGYRAVIVFNEVGRYEARG